MLSAALATQHSGREWLIWGVSARLGVPDVGVSARLGVPGVGVSARCADPSSAAGLDQQPECCVRGTE